MVTGSVHLVRGRERAPENDALAEVTGGRVGLDGVLADLNRQARWADPFGTWASWGFRWDREDVHSSRWWPQGITSSADASPDETYAGRSVVVTTSYSKVVGGLGKGARVSVVDVSDPGRIRYRHVLLVTATLGSGGRVGLRPVRAHAGGIVWAGPYLHVAGTSKGIYSFHVDDVVRVTGTDRPDLLGELPTGGMGGFGHRYVLPTRFVHTAGSDEGVEDVRYSFLSRAHGVGSPAPGQVVAGEYGRGRMTRRLLRYDLDGSGLFTGDEAGVARPAYLSDGGVAQMQGAVSVGGRLHVTTSAGRRGRGSVWVGEAGDLHRFAAVLPPGPEDVCYWPSRDELWTVTEYPGRRLVLVLDRARFG